MSMTAREWVERGGQKYLTDRARFAAFADAVRALAPAVPSMEFGGAEPHGFTFSYAGSPCAVRFRFEFDEVASLIVLESEGLSLCEGAPLDAEGHVGNLKTDGLMLPRDAEAVFFLLLRGPRG